MKYVEKAVDVFLSTGTRFPRRIIWSMGMIKYAAAKANTELGLLDRKMGEAIMSASQMLAEGKLDNMIVVDVFQTGSGTGLNMNVNEVIAVKASELSGLKIHPNDHVNMGQSSNDVVPTAVRVAAVLEVVESLIPTMRSFVESLEKLAQRTSDVIKPGRTHLRDALPVTMGQEFSAYADAFKHNLSLLEGVLPYVKELPIGGTAVGTGINAHPRFGELVVDELRRQTGVDFKVAESRFRAMRLLSDLVALSSVLRTTAIDLIRLCQDLRLMFSGPFTAIGEIDIPQEVAGSSIMPGKTNPVTVEAAMLAAAQVVGLDTANSYANLYGEFELSMAVPLIGYNIVTQIQLLREALQKMETYVINRIVPLRERARELAEKSPALVTVISPIIGYDKASQVALKITQGMSIRQALRELGFSEDEINKILNLERLVKPGIPAKEK
ncbi:fumarate hydratase [Desulfurococcaceae archaeon AG1]|nr:MAG: fumarate hydratase [Desulfurococcaceae archaeon]GAY24930.1 fumarate hydratase [Desulfurococcaceae archaeon AG1]